MCVWVDKKYLRLFSSPVSVFTGVREIPPLHRCLYSSFQAGWLKTGVCFSRALAVFFNRAALHHITDVSEHTDPEKNSVFGSLSTWLCRSRLIAFPLVSASSDRHDNQPKSSIFSWEGTDKYLVPLVPVGFSFTAVCYYIILHRANFSLDMLVASACFKTGDYVVVLVTISRGIKKRSIDILNPR